MMKKKFMRTLLSLSMATAVMVSATACGSKSAESTDTAAKADDAAEETTDDTASGEKKDELNVIYLSCSTASEFWQYIGVGIQNAVLDMEDEYGIKINLQTTGPAEESQTEAYVTAFEEAIAANPAAIVTATQVAEATVPKAQEAVDQGIVLNFVNCGLVENDVTDNADCYNQFYYCANSSIGALAAEQMLSILDAKGIEPKGTVAMNYSVVNANGEQRMKGFSDYMAEHAPDIECTETYYNNNDLETAQSNVENQISTYGDKLIGIYGGNNISGDGAVLAAQTAGITEKVAIIGVDSDATEIEALQNGVLDCIIVQDAYTQGYQAMKNAIVTAMEGENPESEKQINCAPSAVLATEMDNEETKALLDPTILAK